MEFLQNSLASLELIPQKGTVQDYKLYNRSDSGISRFESLLQGKRAVPENNQLSRKDNRSEPDMKRADELKDAHSSCSHCAEDDDRSIHDRNEELNRQSEERADNRSRETDQTENHAATENGQGNEAIAVDSTAHIEAVSHMIAAGDDSDVTAGDASEGELEAISDNENAAEEFLDDLSGKSVSKTEADNYGKYFAGGGSSGLDSQVKQGNTQDPGNRMMAELAAMMNRNNDARNISLQSPTLPQGFSAETETANVNFINNSTTVMENRSVENLFSTNISRASGFQETLDSIIYVIKGKSRMGVAVEHESLGKLNINLSMDKGLVNVQISAADRVVREMLENNMQNIVDRLNEEGVSIGEFSIAQEEHQEREEGNSFLEGENNSNNSYEPARVYSQSGLVNIFA